jgi:hypothetical protein
MGGRRLKKERKKGIKNIRGLPKAMLGRQPRVLR